MKVICDTNVLVRVLLSPGGAAAALFGLLRQSHRLITSAAQLRELFDVIGRPSIVALHKLPVARQKRFIVRLYKMADMVPLPATLPQVVPHDPKDNPIVITAVAGRADVLCTLDRHFFHPDVVAFCTLHGVRVLRDTELLLELRGN